MFEGKVGVAGVSHPRTPRHRFFLLRRSGYCAQLLRIAHISTVTPRGIVRAHLRRQSCRVQPSAWLGGASRVARSIRAAPSPRTWRMATSFAVTPRSSSACGCSSRSRSTQARFDMLACSAAKARIKPTTIVEYLHSSSRRGGAWFCKRTLHHLHVDRDAGW